MKVRFFKILFWFGFGDENHPTVTDLFKTAKLVFRDFRDEFFLLT